jgi:Na+/H+ antiporter NhaD/arsenite permease-like protein
MPIITGLVVFGAVYFATALISSFVTNSAAATLMFPIAIGAAETAGVDLKLMSYCLMLGASDSSTPFGYQTNLMVYGPGGYKVIFLSACLACSTFPVRGSQAFSILYIHTQNNIRFHIGIKPKTQRISQKRPQFEACCSHAPHATPPT